MSSDRTYEYVILGSGISGMSMALFLAQTGANVLVLEKAAVPGGAMQRFRRKGIPLDTGFHFTGGIPGCFGDMLSLAGIRDELETLPVRLKYFFPRSGHCLDFPRGHENAEAYLASLYPEQSEKIHRYFALERDIIAHTPYFDLRKDVLNFESIPGNGENVTLRATMQQFGFKGELRTVLEAMAACYGTPPSEIPLASHCRVNYGILNELCRVRDGGESIIHAFLRRVIAPSGIRLKTNCTVKSFGPLAEDGKCYSAELTDGSMIRFKQGILTIHPREILKLLPAEKVRPAFRSRIENFEECSGFFTVHAMVPDDVPDFQEELTSVLDTEDMDSAVLAENDCHAMGIMLSRETDAKGVLCRYLTAFQFVNSRETYLWENSITGHRAAAYYVHKAEKCCAIMKQIQKAYPQFEGKLELLDSSSMLTYRDYLFSTGSAYGIRQKIGQHNLFGHLPVRNLYVCGQNSILPGAFGAMLSSVILFRKLVGESVYLSLLERNLKRGKA